MKPYPDVANPALLERIPLSARLILDVGCNTGALGADYKRRNPAARYLGIEKDPDCAAIARARLDRVANVDVEQTPAPFDVRQFDCIIYGDSLEHLVDPWALLRAHARLLSDDGTMLICIPNVSHWSFAERLLRGTFDYEDAGLLDRSHLRWFTWETTKRAIAATGLIPHDVTARVFDRDKAEQFADAIAPGLRALGVDLNDYLSRAAPLQYVCRARRQVEPQLTVVSTMLAPVGGVSHVRVIEPLQAISTDCTVTTVIMQGFDADSLSAVDGPRVFIFHRPAFTGDDGLEPIRRVLALGYVVVCEFDDHPDYIPILQRDDIQNFRAVHAVQTSTEPLAEVFRGDNPEVAVFKNAMQSLPEPRNFGDPGRLTLFFGGLNREQDWPPFIEALNNVARFVGERLFFQIVNDRGLYDALDTPHKNFTPLCDYDVYLRLLAHSEISLMPLTDTAFNRCKSDLKFLEAASQRVAALASDVVYGSTIVDGHTGVVFRDSSELQQRLARLVAQPERTRAIADAGRGYVMRDRMLAYQAAERVTWYRSLWARREELNRALLQRVPQLANPATGRRMFVAHTTQTAE
ncbi:MAG TPA: methyltransferase [Acetobacteraceae bacterium]|jgi:SAM-dependent methyltransferase|nr:methyltransferase [Acetobacteraceae bacterium]